MLYTNYSEEIMWRIRIRFLCVYSVNSENNYSRISRNQLAGHKELSKMLYENKTLEVQEKWCMHSTLVAPNTCNHFLQYFYRIKWDLKVSLNDQPCFDRAFDTYLRCTLSPQIYGHNSRKSLIIFNPLYEQYKVKSNGMTHVPIF